LPAEKRKQAFTIIEVVMAMMVLSVFITVIMHLYSRSSDSFKITLWKQERTAQAEIFWAQMRKHLEEATNNINIPTGTPNPNITSVPRPLKFHPNPDAAPDGGNLLAWNVSRTNFAFSHPYAHSSTSDFFFLTKSGRRLILRSSSRQIAQLDDVEKVRINVASVIKNSFNEEEIVPALNPAAVGCLVELSATLTPPPTQRIQGLIIPQNHKFRLNVPPHQDSSPSY